MKNRIYCWVFGHQWTIRYITIEKGRRQMVIVCERCGKLLHMNVNEKRQKKEGSANAF